MKGTIQVSIVDISGIPAHADSLWKKNMDLIYATGKRHGIEVVYLGGSVGVFMLPRFVPEVIR
jgi:hypothetical protein